MTWKDWATGAALALTVATVLIRGGQLVERQEAMTLKQAEVTGLLMQIRADLSAADRALEQQRGIDRLHEEQINTLRRDLDALSRLTRGKP